MKPPPIPPPLPKSAPPQARPSDGSRAVDQQLSRLFGESLFGAWLDPLEPVGGGHRGRKHARWGRRLGVLLVLALVAATGTWLYRRGLVRRAAEERAQVAKDVATFLADGELDRLAQFLAILLPPDKPLQATDPYLDLIVSAESVLYRYQDAAPARLARIEPFLSSDEGHPRRVLARLTVASQPERAEAYRTLLGLSPSFPKDPEYHTLMAMVLERRGDAKAARASWERSAQAGPLWLPHRYQQCAFEVRQRDSTAVSRIVGQMARVAPESAWTRMAYQHFAPGATAPAPTAPAGTAPDATFTPKPPSPVAQYQAELVKVLQRLGAKDLASARLALGRALAATNGQPPFVLDAFAALLDANAADLAMEMTSYDAWPRKSRWADAKLADLEASRAAGERAPTAAPDLPAATPERGHAKVKKSGAAKKKGGKAKKHRSRRRR
jgi:hypothetical protein